MLDVQKALILLEITAVYPIDTHLRNNNDEIIPLMWSGIYIYVYVIPPCEVYIDYILPEPEGVARGRGQYIINIHLAGWYNKFIA